MSEIAANYAMTQRVAQCAAQQGIPNPDMWTGNTRREWAAAPGWHEAWDYALNTHPPTDDQPPYDPGSDEAVITDGMILSQVQAMNAQPAPTA